MKKIRIILLPGLHGTDGLFRSFASRAPMNLQPFAIGYPTQQTLSYEQLRQIVLKTLDSDNSPFLLLGESFSGPLALSIASSKPPGLVGVVLVASFILSPLPSIAKWLPWKTAYRIGSSFYDFLAFITPFPNKARLFREVANEVKKVDPTVLFHRMKAILQINATEALQNCSAPILYLKGSRDPFVRNNSLNRILKIRSDVMVWRIPAPHMVLQTAPDQAWRGIQEFLSTRCAA